MRRWTFWLVMIALTLGFATVAPAGDEDKEGTEIDWFGTLRIRPEHNDNMSDALAGREDKTLVPWAWAINGAMSATVAGAAPIVAQSFGFQSLFLIGALLYGGVLLVPAFRGGRHEVPGLVAATTR